MLNNSDKSGHPCLLPDFRGKAFSFSSSSIMLVVDLSYIAFIMLRYVPSIPTLLSILSKMDVGFYDHVIFISHLVSVVYHVNWFVDIESSLHPWDKSFLIMVYDPFYVLLNSVCWYFVEDFCIYVCQGYWPVIFFFSSVFVWFWYQCNTGLIKYVGKCSLLFYVLKYVKEWC